jgi:hypothetical protein
MQIIIGLVLIIVAAGLIVTGRPGMGQDSAVFLRNWPVGQLYALMVLVSTVTGIGLILNGWPS